MIQDPLFGFVRDRDRDRFLRQILIQLRDHELENLDQIVLAQSVEQNYLVQPVQELGIESALDLVPDQILDLFRNHVFIGRLEAQAFALLQVTRADV